MPHSLLERYVMSKYDNWKGSRYVGSRTWFIRLIRKYEKWTDTVPLTRKEIRDLSDEQLKALFRKFHDEHHGLVR